MDKWQIAIVSEQGRHRISVWGSKEEIDQSFRIWATEEDLYEGWKILMVDPGGDVQKEFQSAVTPS